MEKNIKIGVIGLGYVGLPLAVAFAEKKLDVIAFDINEAKIAEYKKGIDLTDEVGDERLKKAELFVTANPDDLQQCNFYVIAVPTPVLENKRPDLYPLKSASKLVAKYLKKDDIVVYESTVYPGATEEVCVPILEKHSKYKYNEDFFVGFSPERINPGDPVNRLETIVKVTSGSTKESAEVIAQVYEKIIDAGVCRASSIKVAEAAKVIENTQRDINIAFMNELSVIFDKLDINTEEVLKAAQTKWNFLPFIPGLVGGHCIGVDPYYLISKARDHDISPNVMTSAREINDYMGFRVANKILQTLLADGKNPENCRVGILGLTFKADCADCRNTKVADIIGELESFGVTTVKFDDNANEKELKDDYNMDVDSMADLKDLDAVVIAVNHVSFNDWLTIDKLKEMFKKNEKMFVFDIKWLFDENEMIETGFTYWRL